MHEIVTKIRNLLDANNITYSFLQHEPGTTSEEMVEIRKDFSLSEGAKALILSTSRGFVQVVLPGDCRFSNSTTRHSLKVKDIRFANQEELSVLTDGVLPGAVPPFGQLFGIPVYVDEKVFENERIVFNCGERTMSIAMTANDYRTIVNPVVTQLT